MSFFRDLAVIIPVGPKELAWQTLLLDLQRLPKESEILLVGTTMEPKIFSKFNSVQNIKWLKSKKGRACQLNCAAKTTKKKFLWFLHADSRISKEAVNALENSFNHKEDALHYFDLLFLNDGPVLMLLNTMGVWIRSHWMRLPFGDQGFCLPRHLFQELGGFNERASYGEDHLLVWKAHQMGIPLQYTGAAIQTSSRCYRENGWAKTTAKHLIFTAKQAAPQLVKFFYAKP